MPHIRPFIVAIWCGSHSKPNNLDEFLEPFTTELKSLMTSGMKTNERHISIDFYCCICDSPARAFIKGKILPVYTKRCN